MTVRGDRCLLGHEIDASTVSSTRGRRARSDGDVRPRPRRRIALQMPAPRPPRTARHVDPASPREDGSDEPAPVDERVLVGAVTGEHPVVSPPPPPAPEIAAPPRTPSPSGLLELNPTLETVERLWDADVPAPLEEWEPSEFVEPPRIDTSFLVTGALILFAVFALWTAVSELTARQDARLDALHADTVALADLTASLASGGAEERLGEVDTYARSVFSRADDLDLGNPDRALAIEAAGSALDLERALGDAFSYRSAFEAVVERPALPTSGEPERASAAAETLVMWATAISDVVDGAPALGELADHRTEGAAFQETLAAVQQRYLDALRDRDAGAAAAALVELDEAVGRLSAGVQPAVEAVVDRAPAVASEIRRAAGRMSVASES